MCLWLHQLWGISLLHMSIFMVRCIPFLCLLELACAGCIHQRLLPYIYRLDVIYSDSGIPMHVGKKMGATIKVGNECESQDCCFALAGVLESIDT